MAVVELKSPTVVFTEKGYEFDSQLEQLSTDAAKTQQAFISSRNKALYDLGLAQMQPGGDPAFQYLQQVASGFFRVLMRQSDIEVARDRVVLKDADDEITSLYESVPFAIGSEWVNNDWISTRFQELLGVFAEEIQAYTGTVELYFTEKSQHLRVPERVFFHLVENSKSETYPFAFMATYASTDENGHVKHYPLDYALTEYKNDREKLLALLACLNRVSEVSDLIAGFIESGELFHPLRLTSDEAYTFLKQIEQIEACGILCRMPNWWKRKAYQPKVSITMGQKKPSMIGLDAIIDMQPQLVIDGVALSRDEIRQLLAETEGLHMLKGKWVEVDHEKLRALLHQLEEFPKGATLFDVLRGTIPGLAEEKEKEIGLTNGQWLNGFLSSLRRPDTLSETPVPASFHAELRPYQQAGFTWLNMMDSLGFGACLADDMGLGKTVQVLCFLEKKRRENPDAKALLIVPASLIGNWEKEINRFVPEMSVCILHGKTAPALQEDAERSDAFLTITSYGMAVRLESLKNTKWTCIVLDEAQAIKNPGTKQAKAIKQLQSYSRIAMTGTPIENELGNLWSLYDFLDHGLLGNATEFKRFTSHLDSNPSGYAKLKAMISPFLLRRLKTDRRIIRDLPDKQEMIDYVSMSKKQILLYRKVTADLEQSLQDADGMARRGLVLASIMKLKQICNHPDQYLGQNGFDEKESGKLAMLRELCETIRDKRERVLVFTQFKEITDSLAAFLEEVFGRKGLILHGGVQVKKRQALVDAFQGDAYVPFMILSVRAGGTGLNLTRANHVIHFDRWWNPAVENQATDRAFRIGQTKNVMVHKLVCTGTVEEKIDTMIESKKALAEDVIGGGGEKWITELSNRELMSLLRLEV